MRNVIAKWGSVIAAMLTLVGGGLAWAAKAQVEAAKADTERTVNAAVNPVESRVTKLETQRTEDVKKIDDVKQAVDRTNEKIDALKTLIIERLPSKK